MKPKKLKFFGNVKNGVLDLPFRDKMTEYIASLDGQEVYVEIGLRQVDRTTSQNNFYWLYLNIISEETGDDANSLHEFFKRKFLPAREITVLGNTIKIPATTTKLDKHEFSKYLEQICVITGVPIPKTDY